MNDKRRTIDSYVCEVHDLNHPPKVQPEELVDCPDNDRYSQLWPQPKSDTAVDEEKLESGPVATAVRELGRIAREKPALDKTLADLYLETAKSRDSLVEKLAAKPDAGVDDQISTLDRILGMVERLQGKEKGVDQLALFREMLATVREIQKTAHPEGSSSLLGQAKEMAEAVQTFQELFGTTEAQAVAGQASREGEWWQGMLNSKAAEALAASLGNLATLVTLRVMQPGITPAGAPSPVSGPDSLAPKAGTQFNNPATGSKVPTATQPGQPGTLGAERPQTPPASSPNRESAEHLMKAAVAQQIFPYVIQALTDGIPGDELAASVFTLNKLGYTQLCIHGEAGLLEILQSVPEYWSQLQPFEPQVRQMIHEFIEWEDQEESKADTESAEHPAEK
ncbi:MAG: hypothetical protein IH846_10795 [Acidobacteria bacterium]|nr:hypothetical protein [Acidobacteriota bacterium]